MTSRSRAAFGTAFVGLVMLCVAAAGAVMDDIQPWAGPLAIGGIALILVGLARVRWSP